MVEGIHHAKSDIQNTWEIGGINNYNVIRQELKLYNEDVYNKQEIIILNKSDVVDSNNLSKIKNELQKITNNNIYIISAHNKKTCIPVINYIEKIINKNKKIDEW